MNRQKKQSNKPKQIRVTIRVFESDLEYLKSKSHTAGYNALIRGIIRKTVRKLQEKESKSLSETSIGDIEIDV